MPKGQFRRQSGRPLRRAGNHVRNATFQPRNSGCSTPPEPARANITRNGRPCLVLRGVTDLVSPEGGESYDLLELYHQRTDQVMPPILESLPAWLAAADL